MTAAPRLRQALPAVYAAAAARLLLPLVVLPVVAVRLGPEEFGRLSVILVWAGLLSTLIEGGFLAAATRLAVNADAAGRWRLAQQVFSARCVLMAIAVALAPAAALLAGEGRFVAPDALAIALLACALGWPATWYLQATQQLAAWSRIELVVYVLLIAGCWAFAHSVAAFLAMQLAASAALVVLGWRWLRRDLAAAADGERLFARPQVGPGLRMGWAMLPVSIAGAAYSYALPAAASAQMPKAELGLYYMADRIVRALLSAGEPVFALVYPRIVALFPQGESVALRAALRWAAGGAVVGALAYAIGVLAWPWAEGWLASRAGSLDAARLREVTLLLGLLLPLLLGWKFIGYWMLGSGRYDRAYRACMVVGGIVGTLAAATIGGAAGATGLAWTALAVECVVIATAVGGIALTRRAARAGA